MNWDINFEWKETEPIKAITVNQIIEKTIPNHEYSAPNIKLGFINTPTDNKLLSSVYFPCKVGGNPQWLNFHKIPSIDNKLVECQNCQNTMSFLLQIYAPLNTDENPQTNKSFHRMMYIFICTQPNCCKKNSNSSFIVLRSSLHLSNTFYDETPLSTDLSIHDVNNIISSILQNSSVKLCKKCHLGTNQNHEYCNGDSCKLMVQDSTVTHFPEYEIAIYEEDLNDFSTEMDNSANSKYQDLQTTKMETEETEKDDFDFYEESKKDTHYQKFLKVVAANNDQILRYSFNGSPLYATDVNIPTKKDIPKCPLCKNDRVFEFQIMPYLLNVIMNNGSIEEKQISFETGVDWATLLIYTCPNDCQMHEQNYIEEFIWKQDF